MILYHFTNVPADAIKAEGIKPGPNSWADHDYLWPATPKDNVVWLMQRFDPFFMWGKPRKRCCTVVIPSTDRKLVRFEKVLCKCGADRLEGDARKALDFYVYFGAISPDRIREFIEIEFTFDPGIPAEEAERWLNIMG